MASEISDSELKTKVTNKHGGATIFGSIPTIVWTWLELSGAGGMKFRKRAKDESFKLFNPPVNEDVADTRDVYKN